VTQKKYDEAKTAAMEAAKIAQQAASLVEQNKQKMKEELEKMLPDIQKTLDDTKSLAAAAIKKKAVASKDELQSAIGKLELDIIAENKDFIVFAEVKTRSDDFQMHPVTAVNREKQRSMIFAANNYIQWNNIDKESRFDIITIIKKADGYQVDHIEDAFYPTLK